MIDELRASRICGGNTNYKRKESDFYPTPPDVTIALLEFLKIPKDKKIWEPACGENHMVDAMRDYGYEVIGTDIKDGTDFLTAEMPDGVDCIITNPPFSMAEQFIKKCVLHQKPFALLLKSQYWHAKSRLDLFREFTPTHILPLSWRPDFMFGTRGSGSPFMDMMWCVWKDVSWSTYPTYIVLDRPMEGVRDGNRQ